MTERPAPLGSVRAMRERARALFDVALRAADPGDAVRRTLAERPVPQPGAGCRVRIIAMGKAAIAMARAAREIFGPVPALVVTHAGAWGGPSDSVDLRLAGHPVPDRAGAAAAAEALRIADALGERDVLLALISGGASAMMPSPVAGLSLADKIEVNRLLLASGADIAETNRVRQALSRFKGGGLARAAAPARVCALILSDVVGDDPRVIASGPTAAPLGSLGEAADVLRRRGLWTRVPEPVRRHLEGAGGAPAHAAADNRIVGSNALSLKAMAAHAPGALSLEAPLVGDVAVAARVLVAACPREGGVLIAGGETTVEIRGSGQGGRNQELALRVALEMEARGPRRDWVFLSGGTDGRDGPTDAAGGLVDHGTLARMRAAGLDPQRILAANDSYHGLKAAGDLVATGATGTNVADVQVLICG